MKLMLLGIVMIVGQLTSAQSLTSDKVVCVFTEPFLNVEYSPAQQEMTITELSADVSHTFQNVVLTVGAPGEFVVQTEVQEPLLSLVQDGKGSDGMSDDLYPVSAKLTGAAYTTVLPGRPGVDLPGGCRFAD